MVLQLAAAVQTSVKAKQAHIIVTLKLPVFFRSFKIIRLVEMKNGIDGVNVGKTAPGFTASVNGFHLSVQILQKRAIIVNLLIFFWVVRFQNIPYKIFGNFHVILIPHIF